MYYTIPNFTALVNTNLPNNATQDIDADALAEVATAFIDSFAQKSSPIKSYPFKLIHSDLDSNLQIPIAHDLGSTQVRVLLYNRDKIKLINRHFDFQVTDSDNILLTVFAGIELNGVYTGVIYVV